MNFISPKVSAEDVAAATERKFTSEPVEAGEYDMVIKTAPVVKTSKAGNKYLQLMLLHTGDISSSATAVYPNFNANEIGNRQLSQLLLALGFDSDAVASESTGWGVEEDAATDEKGLTRATIMVNGDPIDLAGRPIRVYLKKVSSEFNGKTTIKNEAARFVIL